jgi:methyl-accepting chemotaxis protein
MSDDSDLARRAAFIRLDDKARARLRSLKPILAKAAGPALDVFYDQVRAFPETARFFSNEAGIGRAKAAQERHWTLIGDARYDADYVNGVRRIGEVHARIGLEPRWYIGGYAMVAEQLMGAVVRDAWPKGVMGLGGKGPEPMSESLGALTKAILLDMDFAISVYLERLEAQRAAEAAQRQEAERRQTAAVAALDAALRQLAEGDLTVRVDEALAPEFDGLKRNYNTAVAAMQEALQAIRQASGGIRGGAGEIALASDDLSRRTEQQAASLEETAAAVEELSATLTRSAQGAVEAAKAVGQARGEAEASGEVVTQAIVAMGQIKSSSDQIGQIIGVIDEIAFQTNLLALNAGVEAARAGEAGRGFAVVASEVRMLAQRSAEAAKEIKALIAASTSQVDNGVKLVDSAGAALHRIASRVGEIDVLVSAISTASAEQASGFHQINTAINQMDQVTQQNAAMVEQATAATHALDGEVSELDRRVGHFKLGDQPPVAGGGRMQSRRTG